MTVKHTPGPLNTQKDSGGWIQVRKGDVILANVNPHASAGIEEVFPPPHGNESPPSKERIAEAEANGILFAAAPDLLAELRGWLAIFDREDITPSPLVKAAILSTRAAIAKATT